MIADTVQANVWLLLDVLSLAVAATSYGVLLASPLASVPEISPVLLLMLKPLGKPLALYVIVPPGEVALTCTDTVSPVALACAPGLTKATRGVTVHTNDWLDVALPCVAVTVT